MRRFLRWRRRVIAVACVTFISCLSVLAGAYWATDADSATKPRHVCVVYDLLVNGKVLIKATPLGIVPCPGARSSAAAA